MQNRPKSMGVVNRTKKKEMRSMQQSMLFPNKFLSPRPQEEKTESLVLIKGFESPHIEGESRLKSSYKAPQIPFVQPARLNMTANMIQKKLLQNYIVKDEQNTVLKGYKILSGPVKKKKFVPAQEQNLAGGSIQSILRKYENTLIEENKYDFQVAGCSSIISKR